MKMFPAPLTTAITDKQLSNPWLIWFRNISDMFIKMLPKTDVSTHSTIGNLYFIQYSSDVGGESITFPPAYSKQMLTYFKQLDTGAYFPFILIVEKDQTEVTIPFGKVYLSGFIIIS